MNKDVEILKKMRKAYDTFAEDFAKTRKNKEWVEVIQYLKNTFSSKRILDAGCGYNKYGKYIKSQHICLDFSKKLILISKKENLKSMYVVGDITHLPFKDKIFDYSIAIASIHHLPSKKLRIKAIKEIIRTTNKGVLFSVWYKHQNKFKDKPKEINIGWRKKYFRYYYLYDISELSKEIIHSFSPHIKECLIFLDFRKKNIYTEIVLK